MEKYKDLNTFLESIHLGTKVSRIYKDRTHDEEIKGLLDEIISIFKKHENNISNLIVDKGYEPNEDLSLGRELVVLMERMKLTDDDFQISMELLKAINMGTTKGAEFIYRHYDYDENSINMMKDVIKDYSYIYDKTTKYITDKYL